MAVNIGPKIGIDGEAEYRKSLQNIVQETKTLDAQMGKLEATFEKEGSAQEKAAEKSELLQKKKEALNREVEKIQEAVDAATEKYGENSTQALKWKQALAQAETELANVDNELDDLSDTADDSESALDNLTSTISDQQSELDDLKDAYVDAVLEFGEGSDEANALASEITDLSGELKDNQDKLDSARAAADSLDQTMEDLEDSESAVGIASNTMGSLFSGSIGSIGNALLTADISGLVDGISDAVIECGQFIVDCAASWEESMAIIAIGTGATGEDLDALTASAAKADAAVYNSNSTFQDTSDTLAEVNTRLGLTGEDLEDTTTLFLKFAKATGTDATGAVDSTVDAMKRWHLELDEVTIQEWLDDVTTASQACSLSADDMTQILSDNATQFQALGFSTEEALAFITAFADGGGNTSTIATALRNSIKNLDDATDDLPSSFQTALDMIESADGDMSVLNETVGDTGLTIEEMFGAKVAQEMVTACSDMSGGVDAYSDALENNSGIVEQTYNDTITLKDNLSRIGKTFKTDIGRVVAPGLSDITGGFADVVDGSSDMEDGLERIGVGMGELYDPMGEMQERSDSVGAHYRQMGETLKNNTNQFKTNVKTGFNDMKTNVKSRATEIKTSVETSFTTMKTNASNRFQNMKDSARSHMSDMKSTVQSRASEIRSSVESSFSTMKNNASEKFSGLKESIRSKMSEMASTIRTKLAEFKNAFSSLELKLPHIKLPHFSISGSFSLDPPSKPTISVDWYRSAYNAPMILSDPTIFGYSNGSLLGGGDGSGNEVVVGQSLLMDMMAGSTSSVVRSAITPIYELLREYLPECANTQVYMDSEKVSNIVDQRLGRTAERSLMTW